MNVKAHSPVNASLVGTFSPTPHDRKSRLMSSYTARVFSLLLKPKDKLRDGPLSSGAPQTFAGSGVGGRGGAGGRTCRSASSPPPPVRAPGTSTPSPCDLPRPHAERALREQPRLPPKKRDQPRGDVEVAKKMKAGAPRQAKAGALLADLSAHEIRWETNRHSKELHTPPPQSDLIGPVGGAGLWVLSSPR